MDVLRSSVDPSTETAIAKRMLVEKTAHGGGLGLDLDPGRGRDPPAEGTGGEKCCRTVPEVSVSGLFVDT